MTDEQKQIVGAIVITLIVSGLAALSLSIVVASFMVGDPSCIPLSAMQFMLSVFMLFALHKCGVTVTGSTNRGKK